MDLNELSAITDEIEQIRKTYELFDEEYRRFKCGVCMKQ